MLATIENSKTVMERYFRKFSLLFFPFLLSFPVTLSNTNFEGKRQNTQVRGFLSNYIYQLPSGVPYSSRNLIISELQTFYNTVTYKR